MLLDIGMTLLVGFRIASHISVPVWPKVADAVIKA
jgi:hypothetical protein